MLRGQGEQVQAAGLADHLPVRRKNLVQFRAVQPEFNRDILDPDPQLGQIAGYAGSQGGKALHHLGNDQPQQHAYQNQRTDKGKRHSGAALAAKQLFLKIAGGAIQQIGDGNADEKRRQKGENLPGHGFDLCKVG